jgi:hypothetical protein
LKIAKEEVLGGQSIPRPQLDPDEPQSIQQWIEYGPQHVGPEIELRHQRQDRTPPGLSSLEGVNRIARNYCGRQVLETKRDIITYSLVVSQFENRWQ